MIESIGTIRNGSAKAVAAPVTVISRSTMIVIAPFDFNSATLTEWLRAKVARAARTIKEFRVRTLTLSGFTDPRGSASYNRALSQHRTDAVRTYLLKELAAISYPPKHLTLLGKGKTDFVFADHNQVNNPASRRVVITIDLN
jgi:OOP family OmpA-OmpF porin